MWSAHPPSLEHSQEFEMKSKSSSLLPPHWASKSPQIGYHVGTTYCSDKGERFGSSGRGPTAVPHFSATNGQYETPFGVVMVGLCLVSTLNHYMQ